MNCLCEKYYNPITMQYYIADCVSSVPRLTLLDLGTNWTFEQALSKELIRMRGLTVIERGRLVICFEMWTLQPSCLSLNPKCSNDWFL